MIRGKMPVVCLVLLPLAACASPDAPVAGFGGVRSQVADFYQGRAMEANANCPNPQIDTITDANVVDQTPTQVKMNIRYHWTDEGRSSNLGNGGSTNNCDSFATRTFSFTRSGDVLTVTDMSGLQKRS